MKTKTQRKRSSKRKSTFLMVILYATAMFVANGAIDRVRVMTEEQFWGLFQNERKLTFENPPISAMVAQAAEKEPEGYVDTKKPVEYTHRAKLTAYNSVPEQTDGNPCIAADGTNVCEFEGCVIAQNGVKFGTKVEIEGVGVCEVHDRKNSRYDEGWIDIYFGGRDRVQAAKQFGTKEARYRVVD